jgi:hypothetical protein
MRNALYALFCPHALRPYVVNRAEVAQHEVERLHREITSTPADEERRQLLTRLLACADVPLRFRRPSLGQPAAPFLAIHLDSPVLELLLFTMLTTIGTPLDVTAAELRIESYFPADDATRLALAGR